MCKSHGCTASTILTMLFVVYFFLREGKWNFSEKKATHCLISKIVHPKVDDILE